MRRFLFLLALCFFACVPRVVPPTQALDDAAQSLTASSSARTHALAAFHSLLIEGDAKAATTRFDDALQKDSGDVYALIGQHLLALRLMQPQKSLHAALTILEKAPAHPLAPVAARIVLDLSQLSTSTAALVLERAPKLLAMKQQPDSAHLLRSALANVLLDNGAHAAHAQTLQDLGVPTHATLLGPYSAFAVLDARTPTPPEEKGDLRKPGNGPFGALTPRELHFADGRLSLASENSAGDVYLYAIDFTVPERATYVLRTVTSSSHTAIIDGTEVLTRFAVTSPAPTLTTRGVQLDAGTHRLLVRQVRERQAGHLTVSFQRADGRPAGFTFAPARGEAKRWSGVKLDDSVKLYASAESVRAALEGEAGDALARFLAALDGQGRDPDGAAALLAELPPQVNAPSVAMLRATVALKDRLVPPRTARGRATKELEAILARDDGFVAARVATAQFALEDGRQLDALDFARAAVAAHTPAGAPVLMTQARVELSLGHDAAAALTARQIDDVMPGACDALGLRFDVARRKDAQAESEALLAALSHCPGALTREAEFLRARGDVPGAAAKLEALLKLDESSVQVGTGLVSLYVSARRFDQAVVLLKKLAQQWPRNAQLPAALGDVYELMGRDADAFSAREAALLLDGANLSLRRAQERRKTGRELLDEYAISTQEALKSYEAAPGGEDATSAFVLDAAAIQAFPDGTMVDRVHIIQKALDQQGVQEIAEVHLPPGATVLTLRTLKADGTTLEPEAIDKEGVSLPGVQVGDMIEYEYLLSHPPRGPAQPGFSAGAFYFQVARQPNARSSYVVIAPKGSGLFVDAHNVKAPAPKVEGDYEVLRHEERLVPPYIPEPGAPPSANEWLPFVSVGAGARGNEGLVREYGDAFAGHGLVTHEVRAFAKNAAGSSTGLGAVKAVYAAVHEKLQGRDAGLSMTAAASVTQDRGSRFWLLKASLEALGFTTRLAAVRAFMADPAPYEFPNEGLLPYLCLRVTVPGEGDVWLDTTTRFAPFGELPEYALGGLEAWLLPEPQRAVERLITPPSSGKPGKVVTLKLALSEDGALTGSGEETYSGYEAAQLAEALESLSAENRQQALQSSLSRYFGGADLSGLEVVAPREVGAQVVVRYELSAPRFARVEGAGRLVASPPGFPLLLGRRFLLLQSRSTPLFIDSSEASVTKTTLTLPAGWALKQPLGDVKAEGPSGRYLRQEVQSGREVQFNEDFSLSRSRVQVRDYEDFARFAGEVDLLQLRDLLFEKP